MKLINQAGTAILVVILTTAILLTGLTVLWRSASLSYESAMLHYRAKKYFYANESLILYGIALLKGNALEKFLIEHKKPVNIYKGSWPLNSPTWGELNLNYNQKSKQITFWANLFNNDHLEPLVKTQVVCLKKASNVQVIAWINI